MHDVRQGELGQVLARKSLKCDVDPFFEGGAEWRRVVQRGREMRTRPHICMTSVKARVAQRGGEMRTHDVIILHDVRKGELGQVRARKSLKCDVTII